MTQRSVEIVIGRLATDEAFRARFEHDPEGVLARLLDLGAPLTPSEVAALVATAPELWARFAAQIDPRLQKAALTPET